MITREKFIERMGREPIDDDLERSNCPETELGHWYCGWDEEADLPEFQIARRARRLCEESCNRE
jgi:hypothetical protein